MQRHQDADRGIEAGAHIHHRGAETHRAGGRVAVDAHQPGHRLQDRVIARQAAQRAIGAEAGDAAMDQPGKPLLQHRLIAQPPFLHRARLEVLDQHVGAFEQAQQHRLALRLAKVQRQRALVAVDADEVAGVALVERRAPVAHLVALRRLDLDHLGAVVRQDHRAVGAAEHPGQVDDLDPGQRARAISPAPSHPCRVLPIHPWRRFLLAIPFSAQPSALARASAQRLLALEAQPSSRRTSLIGQERGRRATGAAAARMVLPRADRLERWNEPGSWTISGQLKLLSHS